jgi:hypothetical protein
LYFRWPAADRIMYKRVVKVKLSLFKTWRPLGFEMLRLPHFQTFGSQMAAKLSALCAGRFLPPGKFLVLISVRG